MTYKYNYGKCLLPYLYEYISDKPFYLNFVALILFGNAITGVVRQGVEI